METLEKGKGHYRFDLNKAVSTPYCDYFLRLAVALNDLLSVQQLLHLDLSSQPSHVRTGLGTYLTKLHAGHIVEAYIAFVEKIRPNKKLGTSDLYRFLTSSDNLKNSFSQLETILMDKRFRSLRQVRNSFAFHFNYEDDGQDTMDAVASILSTDADDPDIGLIIHNSDFLTDRFSFADHIVIAGWLNLAEVQNPDSGKGQADMRADIKFVGEATGPFLRFAKDGILEWIVSNKLQLPKEKLKSSSADTVSGDS